MMVHKHKPKADRAQRAVKVVEARAKRSAAEQLKFLDQRLGEGAGAKKERARLAKLV